MNHFCIFCSKPFQFEPSELGMEKACPRCGSKDVLKEIPIMPLSQQLKGVVELLGEWLMALIIGIIGALITTAVVYVVVQVLRNMFGGGGE